MLPILELGMWLTAISFLALGLTCSSRANHWKNKSYGPGDKALEKSIIWNLRGDIFMLGITLSSITMGIVFMGYLMVFTGVLYLGLSGYMLATLFLPSWDQHKKELVEVQYKRYQNQ